ncbi:hypothetical protein [Natranaerobius trueperi]|uniref:Uncharacterized protein n=1 Tax=Natranaerobius trueperi TaxID=759412 RepID=A0A226BWM7_9FIRM|nr:hypothetical protein [Natranaerobius trueperi]OWZ83365.1 hypothetical protein CDO51_09095 [Natranaerobius trueperi]
MDKQITEFTYIDLEGTASLTELNAICHTGSFIADCPVMEDGEIASETQLIEIGKYCCYFVPGSDVITGDLYNLIDMADSISGDCLWAVERLVDEDGILKEDYSLRSGVLFIDWFEIVPQYDELKEKAMDVLIRVLGTSASAVGYIVDYDNSENELTGPFLGKFDFVMQETNSKGSLWLRKQV